MLLDLLEKNLYKVTLFKNSYPHTQASAYGSEELGGGGKRGHASYVI